jgi:hypothetical protein
VETRVQMPLGLPSVDPSVDGVVPPPGDTSRPAARMARRDADSHSCDGSPRALARGWQRGPSCWPRI